MKAPLSWKNLIHNRVRTGIGIAGVGFAVILIFMQMGFKGGIRHTATQIYDALDFDLMLRSPAYLHLTEARTIPRSRIHQANSLDEVTRARPFFLSLSEWQAPVVDDAPIHAVGDQDSGGQWRGIITMGTSPDDPAFRREDIRQQAKLLTDPRFVLMDVKSKPEYGPANGVRFSEEDLGVRTTLGPIRIKIVGLFELGTGMAANGACLINTEGYVQTCPWQTIEVPTFGLLKLRDPTRAEEVRLQLKQMFGIPHEATHAEEELTNPAALTNVDVEILTRAEVNAREEHRWVVETPLGQIFTLGVWVALFVGVAIVYQVLSNDIANMMGEYATLKAMGYSRTYLTTVVLQQSVLLGLMGYIPSLAISWILYEFLEQLTGMPLTMTPEIMLSVLLLAIGMCVISGIAALRKLYQADPADLF